MKSFVRSIAAGVGHVLERAGYSLIPTWRLEQRDFARHLQRLFDCYEVDCVIDIGANEGGYAHFLRHEVGYQGVIHSFEPVSALAEKCRQRAQGDPLWHIHQAAMGETDGTLEINVMANSVFSSFLAPLETAADMRQHGNQIARRETVTVRSLASVFPELQKQSAMSRPYLKIDTQGFDLHVLHGAGATLDMMVALQTELSFRPIYENMPDWTGVLALLRDRQFLVSNMFAVTIENNMRAVEFDCIMVNARADRTTA